jgi:hypothetical protein
LGLSALALHGCSNNAAQTGNEQAGHGIAGAGNLKDLYKDISSKDLIFYDIHDGDYKKLSIRNDEYTILPHANNQKWMITGNFNRRTLQGPIDFNVKNKPNPPPVPLQFKFQKILPSNKISIVFFDPSGTISPPGPGAPANIWYNVEAADVK